MDNCQYCNDELNNKRAKNCPACNSILSEANKRNVYGFVMEAYQQAKSDNLSGQEMRDTMKSAIKFGQSKRSEWSAEYRKMQQKRVAEHEPHFNAVDEEIAEAIDAANYKQPKTFASWMDANS